ncbi:hypothetical protein QTP88_006741 [Uroleucon formosanum]
MEQHYQQSRLYYYTDLEDDAPPTTEFRLTLNASQLDDLKNTCRAKLCVTSSGQCAFALRQKKMIIFLVFKYPTGPV